jgi:hypothetical protein
MNRASFDTNRKSSTMSASARAFAFALRTLLVCAALAMPVLAMPAIGGVGGDYIEAPVSKKKGAGFVLLVSLQRS